MSEFLGGGEKNELVRLGVEKNTLANILRPLISCFVKRLLNSFSESLGDSGKVSSIVVEPDIRASGVDESFVYLRNWTVKFNNSDDERANQLLVVRFFGFLQERC